MEQRKLGDGDGLYVYKLFDSVDGELASVAAFLDAAEGESRVGAHGFVDEDATALNPLGSDILAARQVAIDDATAQPERRIISGRARICPFLDAHYGLHRPDT